MNTYRKRKVAVYIRVSSDDQARNETHINQEEVIRKYVENRSETLEFAWDNYWYRDLWVSWVTDIKERPELSRLMDDLQLWVWMEEKPFDIVIVYRLDRMARTLSILLQTLDILNDFGVGYISTQEAIDTSTAFGRAMIWIIWTFAELERELIQNRTQLWIERSRSKWIWSKEKYWYNKIDGRPVINESEAEIVQTMFDLFVNKKYSINDIIKTFEELRISRPDKSVVWKGIYTREDKTIRKYLADETYTGVYYYNKTRLVKEWWKKKTIQLDKSERLLSDIPHDAIVDDETFNKAQEILSNMKVWKNRWVRKNSDWELKFLLSWYLKCDHCKDFRTNKNMIHFKWTKTAKIHEYYICNWKNSRKFGHEYICPVVPIAKKDLEILVLHHIKNIFYKPDLISDYLESQNNNKSVLKQNDINIKQYQELINWDTIQKKKDRINELYTEWHITKIQFHEKLTEIEKQLQFNKDRLKQELAIRNNNTRSKIYIDTLKIAKELSNIEALLENRVVLEKLLKLLVNEIIVYSREATKEDKIAGRKKESDIKQFIPYYTKVVFNTPSDIIKWFINTSIQEIKTSSADIIMKNGKFYNSEGNEVVLKDEIDRFRDGFWKKK